MAEDPQPSAPEETEPKAARDALSEQADAAHEKALRKLQGDVRLADRFENLQHPFFYSVLKQPTLKGINGVSPTAAPSSAAAAPATAPVPDDAELASAPVAADVPPTDGAPTVPIPDVDAPEPNSATSSAASPPAAAESDTEQTADTKSAAKVTKQTQRPAPPPPRRGTQPLSRVGSSSCH